jgi:hypothetical protein
MASVEDQAHEYTDRLVFRPDSESHANHHIAGWTGPWPPPEIMFTATGLVTGKTTVFTADSVTPDALAAAAASPSIIIHRYTRWSASEAPSSAPPDAHWFRGALYVLDEEEWLHG